MFHVSFLIKEGRAKIVIRDGLPLILPLSDKRSGKSVEQQNPDEKNQAILGLTMDDWEELIEIFGIQEAMIHHDLKKIGKGKGKKAKYDNGE